MSVITKRCNRCRKPKYVPPSEPEPEGDGDK